MSQPMEAGRPDPASTQMPRFLLMTSAGRFLIVVVGLVLILITAVVSYVASRIMGDYELKAANVRIVQVQNENQRLLAQNTNHLGTIADFQAQLKESQAKLAAIMPTENTYNINPNQSLVVADGRLTIGLIGMPSNQGVNVNINGKSQLVPVGAIIPYALDASTNCQVVVQSFDMFRAVLTASCTPPKSK